MASTTFGGSLTVGREMTDEDRARFVQLAVEIEADPDLLPYLRAKDPDLARSVDEVMRSLAIEASSHEWRSPIPDVGGRPEQLIPGTSGSFSSATDWFAWILMGGRGSGKTRTGAEAVRELILDRDWHERPMGALVGQTLEDVRTTMVENTLFEVLPPGSVTKWNRGPCELELSNGAHLKGFSSEVPRKLRGWNFHLGWGDELATWKDSDRSPQALNTTWSTLKLAVRAHDRHTWVPRVIGTTTPKSVKLLRNIDPSDALNPGVGLIDDVGRVVVSQMSTLDNQHNLAKSFLDDVVQPLIGTRLYNQEVLGELVDESLNAQWSSELIDAMIRPESWPEGQAGGLRRIVIGVDPSIGAGTGDECGIVVVGLAADDRAYILEDLSRRCPAKEWVEIVASAFSRWGADCVVVEVNQGGELVAETIGRYAPNLPIKEVWAKRGKILRAEPIAMLSDQKKVRFAGDLEKFRHLMHQMRTWEGDGPSPDRLDAMVYAALYLLPVFGGTSNLFSVVRSSGHR